MDRGDVAWMLTSSALVFIMTPGLAFFYGGLVKRKNVVNTIMSSVMSDGHRVPAVGARRLFAVLQRRHRRHHRRPEWFGLNFDTLNDTTLPYPNT